MRIAMLEDHNIRVTSLKVAAAVTIAYLFGLAVAVVASFSGLSVGVAAALGIAVGLPLIGLQFLDFEKAWRTTKSVATALNRRIHLEREEAPEKAVLQAGGRGVKFQIFTDQAGAYRWQLKAGDGEIIADSGVSYVSRSDCERSMALVIRLAQSADIEVVT